MKKEELRKKINMIIDITEDLHPYKERGNVESYSSYNEGWSDACDIILSSINIFIDSLD